MRSIFLSVKQSAVIQGRLVNPSDVGLIGDLLASHPEWNRTRLSQELCQIWNWRNAKGQLKDMAARSLLLKLEARGAIRLPARVGAGRPNHRGLAPVQAPAHDVSPIEGSLCALRPLRIEVLSRGHADLDLFKFFLQHYHYLGWRSCVGENLKLMVRDARSRVLACLLFGAAAWKTAPRDAFIGWSPQERQRNLPLLANNNRFLILPWVRVPHLASHLLARVCRQLRALWVEHYGHPVELLETFVERARFAGTCYRAAGWTLVGSTAGRGRNDTHCTRSLPAKDIFLLPLSTDFRRRLTA